VSLFLVNGELENNVLSGQCLVHSGEGVQLVLEVVLIFAVKEAIVPERNAQIG